MLADNVGEEDNSCLCFETVCQAVLVSLNNEHVQRFGYNISEKNIFIGHRPIFFFTYAGYI